jgi:crossover junction endodeoxyribonuclease RusA
VPLAAPGVWEFPLHFRTPPLSMNDRPGNRQQEARQQAEVLAALRWVIRAETIPALPRIRIELHYFPARAGRRDPINLCATLKPLQDAVVAEGIVPDDIPQYVEHVMPVIHRPVRVGAGLWCRVVDLHMHPAISPSAPSLADQTPADAHSA